MFIVLRCKSKLSQVRHRIRLHWIPSHVGLDGNECADSLASDAAIDPDYQGESVVATIHYEDIQRLIKRHIYERTNDLWTSSSYAPFLHAVVFPVAPKTSKHILGDSATSRQLARLRCGYVSCNAYLHRHGLAPSTLCQHCLLHAQAEVVDSVGHAFMGCPEHSFYTQDFIQSCKEILG